MFLKVAKVVFGLSSYIDGNLLKWTSGFLIEWDKNSRIGTILTSAFLICSKSKSFDDDILGTDEYAPHAEVYAHLLDKHDTVVNAELIKYHKHYNFALYKIKIDAVAGIPPFSEVQAAFSRITTCSLVVRSTSCVARLHAGMKFSAIKFLDPIHREKIIRKCDIDTGLIVIEVSEGSVVEKVGIRNGDVIMCWNGESVSTTIEEKAHIVAMEDRGPDSEKKPEKTRLAPISVTALFARNRVLYE
ncbi:hypothetical protein QOZ80_5AG0404980 [Eleusine coracana subsp. coracana]|nr:hypothetical protein QOZ80_5AG0404980 [Eleusine coracana subsp. coracana]